MLTTTGATDEAWREHDLAETIATDIGDHYELARAHDGRSALLAGAGQHVAARAHAVRALSLYDELRVPEAAALRTRHGL
ncbi:hypothetical protein AB0P21_41145 [Kribbella sp. NPDC056861]|uniref:hypothetical protein n=1 Tax=Kribbella sp. NPDC056861 TaxID=3154857 RepID=UPI00342B75CC